MLTPYLDVLRSPGALSFSLFGFVARMPISMLGIGFVLLVSAQTGSYGLAGAVSAVGVIATSIAAPLQARLADRYGQARVLRPAITLHVVAGALFLVLVEMDAPRWTWFATAAVTGGALPQIGSLVRARWAYLHAGTQRLHTAYALESVLDEAIFIIGPVLVTVLATQVHHLAGLASTFVLTLAGGLAFASLRDTEPPPHPRPAHGLGGPSPIRRIAAIVTAFLFLGGVFGSVEVVTVAYADEAGRRGVAGLVLAAFAAGSLLAGLVFGLVNWRSTPQQRFAVGTSILAVAMIPLPFVPTLWWLATTVFVAGFTISPTLITGFSLVQTTVPASRLTEGLAWLSTALGVGVALGASVSGPVVDHSGASAAYLVTVVCGVLAALISGLTAVRSGRSRRRRGDRQLNRAGQAEIH